MTLSRRARAFKLPAVAAVAVLALSACSPQAYVETDEDKRVAAAASAAAVTAAANATAASKAAFEASTTAVPAPDDGFVNYLLVGDSLANGAAATEPAKSFRELIGARLAEVAPVQPMLAGKAGQGVSLIAPQALSAGEDFDVVVVEVGTNDVEKTEVAEFARAYTAMVQGLRSKSPDAALVCLGPWRDDKVGLAYGEEIAKACTASSGRYRPLSQHYAVAMNRWTSGVMSNGRPAEDNFHPSDAGHFEIASEVLNALRLNV